MKKPDITPAQVVALVQAVLALIVAYGIDVPKDAQDAIVQLATILGGLLIAGDAVVRNGRARIEAARVANGQP